MSRRGFVWEHNALSFIGPQKMSSPSSSPPKSSSPSTSQSSKWAELYHCQSIMVSSSSNTSRPFSCYHDHHNRWWSSRSGVTAGNLPPSMVSSYCVSKFLPRPPRRPPSHQGGPPQFCRYCHRHHHPSQSSNHNSLTTEAEKYLLVGHTAYSSSLLSNFSCKLPSPVCLNA